jgi:hypothetical protein
MVSDASWHLAATVRTPKNAEVPKTAKTRSSSVPVERRLVEKRSTIAPENAVHMAAARMKANPVPAAMFIVVQTFTYESQGRAVYQTTVWRIPLAPVPNPGQSVDQNQISRKQT